MNLQHFPTQHPHNDKKDAVVSNRLLIGTFSVPSDKNEISYGDNMLTPGITEQVHMLLEKDDMQWVIGESYGGLYLHIDKHLDPFRFDYTFRVAMFVFVNPETYTFCRLKYNDIVL